MNKLIIAKNVDELFCNTPHSQNSYLDITHFVVSHPKYKQLQKKFSCLEEKLYKLQQDSHCDFDKHLYLFNLTSVVLDIETPIQLFEADFLCDAIYTVSYWLAVQKDLLCSLESRRPLFSEDRGEEETIRQFYVKKRKFPLDISPMFASPVTEMSFEMYDFCWKQLSPLLLSSYSNQRLEKLVLKTGSCNTQIWNGRFSCNKLWSMLPERSSSLYDYYLYEKTTHALLCKIVCDSFWNQGHQHMDLIQSIILQQLKSLAKRSSSFTSIRLLDSMLNSIFTNIHKSNMSKEQFSTLIPELFSVAFSDEMDALYQECRIKYLRFFCEQYILKDGLDTQIKQLKLYELLCERLISISKSLVCKYHNFDEQFTYTQQSNLPPMLSTSPEDLQEGAIPLDSVDTRYMI